MAQSIRVLLIEDSHEDAKLIMRELHRAGFDPDVCRVDAEADYLVALQSNPDIILADYTMPQFSGLRALDLLKKQRLEIPFILVSGTIGDEQAVAAIKRGATDYLLKDRLARLGSAVSHALKENITRKESERAEEAMRESEHKYRHLFEHLSEAAFLIDSATGRILDTNACAGTMLGYSRADILGANEAKLFPFQDQVSAINANPYKSHVQAKDGSMIPVRISCAPVVLYQRSLVLALITDVMDLEPSEALLRKSEERLRLALAASRMGVCEWNAQANSVFWSPECYAILGRSHIGDTLESITSIVHPDDVKRVMDTTNSAIANRTICEIEFRVTRPDGEVRWLATFAKAKYDEKGRALGVVGTLRDITTQRPLAEELQQSQKMEAMGKLAGSIAHGFNNILGVILGNVELAKADLGPEHPSLENLEEILEAARRAKDLVKQVLSFSRQPTPSREILEFPTLNPPSPHHGHGLHILYVDDERALVSLTKRALERLGYHVSGFSSPSQALRAFRRNPGMYDLVITDMNMPGSNGLEFARELLKMKPDVPVVLSSGYVTAELETNAREIGIRHVIYKPDTVDAAIESIRGLVPGVER